jgi:hypothetical protein
MMRPLAALARPERTALSVVKASSGRCSTSTLGCCLGALALALPCLAILRPQVRGRQVKEGLSGRAG